MISAGKIANRALAYARTLLSVDVVLGENHHNEEIVVALNASLPGHRSTRQDYAYCIPNIVNKHLAKPMKIRLVEDNLNTHDGASLCEEFSLAEAHRIVDRIKFHYTLNYDI